MADILPRVALPYLERAARALPVVVLTGARQTGKSTLATMFSDRDSAQRQRAYVNLDDPATLGLAQRDPQAFVAQAPALVIDEVQREPRLLLAIKAAVDGDRPRRAGRFILTGSANLLLLAKVQESLAGRAAYVTLAPLTRREQLGFGTAGIWSDLLASPPGDWRQLLAAQNAPMEDWRELARRGGYPPVAYELRDDASRGIWFDGYLRSYLQRDVPQIAAIENVPGFDTILRSIALRTATIVNQTQLSRDAGIPQSTVQRYVSVLEASYQLHRLRAWSGSRTRQLVKSPKYYWVDSGLALFLSREREPRGEHLETVVLQDLVAWAGAQAGAPQLSHWRTPKGHEVDFVIEAGTRLLPVEVKATAHPSTRDLASMRVFLAEHRTAAQAGLLLHSGEQTFWIAENVLATPWWRVL
jgi:predicted AAA+ superfamily ATPase